MKISRQDHDDLNATITMVVEKDDYAGKFTEELKKHKGKAHLKGFRKGKTPLSAIKKMYGKPLLAELINKEIDDKLFGFLKEENIEILGSPIPSQDQEMVDFNVNELEDYTFSFDIGKAPALEVQGVSEADNYSQYKVEVDDKIIDDEMDMRRKRLGVNEDIEDTIEKDDILTIKAFELESGKRKDKGWETGFTIMVERIGEEELKESILKSKVNDTFNFNIYKIEKDASEDHVKKYLLNLDPEEEKEIGEEFEGLIEKVSRRMPAELNDDFFEKAFPGEEIKDEAAARDKISEHISTFYSEQTKSVMYRDIMEAMMDKNSVTIPEDFLKRWLLMTNKQVTEQNIQDEFEPFTKNLQWNLIKNSLVKKYNLVVEPDELRAFVKKKISGYMQQYGGGTMDLEPLVDQMLSNREAVEKEYSEIEAEKLFEEIARQVTIEEKPISIDDFREVVNELNEKQK